MYCALIRTAIVNTKKVVFLHYSYIERGYQIRDDSIDQFRCIVQTKKIKWWALSMSLSLKAIACMIKREHSVCWVVSL